MAATKYRATSLKSYEEIWRNYQRSCCFEWKINFPGRNILFAVIFSSSREALVPFCFLQYQFLSLNRTFFLKIFQWCRIGCWIWHNLYNIQVCVLVRHELLEISEISFCLNISLLAHHKAQYCSTSSFLCDILPIYVLDMRWTQDLLCIVW